MSEMIERVARTIEAVLRNPPVLSQDMYGRVSSDWIACEVIRAMREPSEAAVQEAAHDYQIGEQLVRHVWRVMIDAALSK